MLVIPERETIFVLPPRTGTSSLHTAVREQYPLSFMLYRHAERGALPPGYERYRVAGFVRHPVARMWSLYKFLCCLDPAKLSGHWAQEEVLATVENVQTFKGFEDWLCNNQRLFLPEGTGNPQLYQSAYMPETRKSQAIYLRPDLGTEILHFPDYAGWQAHMGLPPLRNNGTRKDKPPVIGREAQEHIEHFMSWENELGLEIV